MDQALMCNDKGSVCIWPCVRTAGIICSWQQQRHFSLLQLFVVHSGFHYAGFGYQRVTWWRLCPQCAAHLQPAVAEGCLQTAGPCHPCLAPGAAAAQERCPREVLVQREQQKRRVHCYRHLLRHDIRAEICTTCIACQILCDASMQTCRHVRHGTDMSCIRIFRFTLYRLKVHVRSPQSASMEPGSSAGLEILQLKVPWLQQA